MNSIPSHILHSASFNILQSGVVTVLFVCYMAGATWNCCLLGEMFPVIIIIIIDNFCIALFSGIPKLTALYNILQHFLVKFHKRNTYNYDN